MNTAVGHEAMKGNTTGDGNTAVGFKALLDNTSADYNTAVGHYALLRNTSGTNNTAVGRNSLEDNTTGHSNSAVGISALENNTTGIYNTSIGRNALRDNTTGQYNSALGFEAGKETTTGAQNTYFGAYTGSGNTTHSGNTGIGYTSLQNVDSAGNTAVGWRAGTPITTGTRNVCIGYEAGTDTAGITTGNYNICVGAHTRPGGYDHSNSIVLGYNIQIDQNYFAFGKASNYVYNGFTSNASWTRSSDVRLKKNIVTNTLGLDFINALRPVTFNWKDSREIDSTDPELASVYNADENLKDSTTTFHGFIAQEVRAALDAAGVDNHGSWNALSSGIQGVSIEAMVTPLVKAVQELSTENEALKARLTAGGL